MVTEDLTLTKHWILCVCYCIYPSQQLYKLVLMQKLQQAKLKRQGRLYLRLLQQEVRTQKKKKKKDVRTQSELNIAQRIGGCSISSGMN